MEAQQQYAAFQNQAYHLISKLDQYNQREPQLRRRLKYLSTVGPAALQPDQLDRVN